MRIEARREPDGFTLVELLVVMIIVGILAAFILVAAMEGIRRAEERQTQATIIKLEAAVIDRMESLASRSVTPTLAHYDLASLYAPGATSPIPGSGDQR